MVLIAPALIGRYPEAAAVDEEEGKVDHNNNNRSNNNSNGINSQDGKNVVEVKKYPWDPNITP